MYKSMTVVGKDDNAGTELLNKYLDMIDGAATATELIKVNAELSEEICFAPLMDFSVVTDMKDSTKHVASFDVPETSFTKEFYEDSNSAQMQIFTDHMSNLLMLVGEDEQSAAEGARLYFCLLYTSRCV